MKQVMPAAKITLTISSDYFIQQIYQDIYISKSFTEWNQSNWLKFILSKTLKEMKRQGRFQRLSTSHFLKFLHLMAPGKIIQLYKVVLMS